MPSPNVYGGHSSLVTSSGGAVHTTRHWRIVHTGEPPSYVASNTSGGTGRETGVSDWQGIYVCYDDTPVDWVGQDFTFTGVTDGNVGYSGPAIVDRIQVLWDHRKGALLEYRVYFSSDGKLEKVSAQALSDVGIPDPPSSVQMVLELDTVAEPDVYAIELNFYARNKKYVSSDTAGQTKRVAGPVDCDCTYSVYQADPANLPNKDQHYILACYVTAGTHWEVTWLKIKEIREFGATPDSPEPVSATIFGEFNCSNGTSLGTIKNPAGTTVWP